MNELMTNHLCNSLSNNILDLHILPTEQCNFRCTYCYENFHLQKMQPETIRAIKLFLDKRIPKLQQLKISWFGGEPLAAIDVVLEISRYAKKSILAQQGQYNFGMTTNGYLLDQCKFIVLFAAGVSSYQISLDGPENIHDSTRKRADGKGTFKRIWKNLLNLRDMPGNFEIILRIHVTPENFLTLPKLLEDFNKYFAYDPRFKVFFKAIENLGGPKSGSFSTLKGKDKVDVLNNLRAYVNKNNLRTLTNNELPYVCYASARNAWVIRSDGALAKCTVLLEDDRNRVGRIKDDGTLELEQSKLSLWSKGFHPLEQTTFGCPASQLSSTSKLTQIPVKVN